MSNSDALPYRMPAEWEPHAATLLAWPHQTADWPGKFAAIPWVYAEIIRCLTTSEPVMLLVKPGDEEKVKTILTKANADLAQVEMIATPTDRAWVRDSGPTIVTDSADRRRAIEWQFNAWAKYDNWREDQNVPATVAAHLEIPLVKAMHHSRHVTLEGGAIDVNGHGALLTTEECLLSNQQCRNPDFTRREYETVFSQYLGTANTLWLNRGIEGDDTHGHVDDLARFVNRDTIALVVEQNRNDPNYEPLHENRERLRATRNASGRPWNIVELPMPSPLFFRKQRLPASYANFYIGNSVVLVPTFNDPADRVALGMIAELFPDRKVIGIHSVDLVWGFGTLHCLSQQIPAET